MKSGVEDLAGRRKFPFLKNKRGSMIGVLHPGEDKKFSMTGVKSRR